MQFSRENIDLFEQNWDLAHAQNSRNVDKAVEYADKALAFLNVEVAKENPEALYLKGNLYQYGVAEHLNTGIGLNVDIAKKFLSEAAKHDFEPAITALDFINKETSPDYIELKQGFENGDLEATYLFANKYLVEVFNQAERHDILLNNSEGGHRPSMLAVSENFRTGSGTDINPPFSKIWNMVYRALDNNNIKVGENTTLVEMNKQVIKFLEKSIVDIETTYFDDESATNKEFAISNVIQLLGNCADTNYHIQKGFFSAFINHPRASSALVASIPSESDADSSKTYRKGFEVIAAMHDVTHAHNHDLSFLPQGMDGENQAAIAALADGGFLKQLENLGDLSNNVAIPDTIKCIKEGLSIPDNR